MGRAIIIAALVVLCSFGFVLVQLARSRPRGGLATGPAQILQTREDGSVYAVSVQLTRLEQRVINAEERSQKLTADVDGLRKERDGLTKQVEELQGQVEQLRKELSRTPASDLPPAANAPAANGPAANGPATPPPANGE